MTTKLHTVKSFSAQHPEFSEASLRFLIFRSKPRYTARGQVQGNGLAESGALIRLGARILIEEEKFFDWVMAHGANHGGSAS